MFMLSPGVHVTEKDLTNIIPAVATSIGGFAGPFGWGPVLDTTTISSETDLLNRFGKPNMYNAAYWFTAANYLSYTNNLVNVRADTRFQRNAVSIATGSVSEIVVNPGGAGVGYNAYTDVVVIDPPDRNGGRQATADFTVNYVTGAVTGIKVTEPGSGYDYAPDVSVVRYPAVNGRGFGGYCQLGSGSVTSINIEPMGAGLGYVADEDTVFISAPTGAGGVQATADMIVDGSGTITGFTITEPGSGYTTAPTVSIVLDTGNTGAGFNGTTSIARGVSAVVVSPNRNGEDYTTTNYRAVISAPDLESGTQATATFTIVPETGGILEFTITQAGTGYTSIPTVSIVKQPITTPGEVGSGLSATAHIVLSGMKVNNEADYYNYYENTNEFAGQFVAKYPGAIGNSISVSMADNQSFLNSDVVWPYRTEFDKAPDTSPYVDEQGGYNDEMHIIVIDRFGKWTGMVGGVLERFAFVSKAEGARRLDGANNYYKDVINQQSKYIWWTDHPSTVSNWGGPPTTGFESIVDPITIHLTGGTDDFDADDGDLLTAYDMLGDAEKVDVNLIMAGPASAYVSKYIIQNICERRKDCMAFCSPVNIRTGAIISGYDAAEQIVDYRNVALNISSSYGSLDSGYKYQLDRYNDVYRWVPLNGDIAGLCARTDDTNDPWWSPGGLNRGQIKNVMKLAFNPNQTDRDNLYKAGINPVVSFPGQGVVLWGDKTLLAKPSAFDRINVRRLFIVLEKAIATAAKFMLFEFNDRYTRKLFVGMVEPYLRNIMSRRGIYDFRVICDESNNTGEVIDSNSFVADIYIKPARSINHIYLNFIAVRTAVSFEEAVGY